LPSRFCLVAYLYKDWPEPEADLTKPFEFGAGVRLQRVEPWMQSGSVAEPLGRIQREILAEPHRFVIAVDYEAENADRGAVRKLQDATTALWLAKPSAVGSRLRLDLRQIDDEVWIPTHIGAAVRLHALETYKNARLTAEDLKAARKLYFALTALPEEGPVRMAATMLLDALHASSWPLRYAQLWIALEGLFGAQSPGEVIFQLAYRMATFLKGGGSDGRELFRRVKRDYAIRSAIVHGMREKRIADSDDVMATAEDWVQQALLKILSDATVTEKFNAKTRDQWLEEMIFDITN